MEIASTSIADPEPPKKGMKKMSDASVGRISTTPPKISIVVPVYNTSQYLPACLDSLLAQDYSNYEIILVDDGSTDDSGALCNTYAAQDSRIRVHHKKNGGLISAWKAGVTLATGDYVLFVDSDDWIDQTMLSSMAAFLTGTPDEIVATDYIIERPDGHGSFRHEYVRQQLPSGSYNRAAMQNTVIPNLLGHESRYVSASRCMKLISRPLILQNMHYCDARLVMGEDSSITFPCLLDCGHLTMLHEAYYHYRYVDESMAHKYKKGLSDNIELLRQTLQTVINDKFADSSRQTMLHHLDRETIFLYFLILKNEAFGNPQGAYANIHAFFSDEERRKLFAHTRVQIHSAVNRLLYFVARHPNHFSVRLLIFAAKQFQKSNRNG
jgi:glycosyltransferase involved in cell wall biosynthesis